MLSLIPIFIGAFLLTIFSMICSFTITIKQQMKDYAIYGICGMPWKKSAWISIFTAGVMSVLSLILGVILTWILTTRGIITFTTIQVGVIPVLSCLALIIIYIGIAAILPNALLNGISLNDVMRNNE
jgi:hypothetical protein